MVVITGSSTGDFGYEYATVVYRETLPPLAIALVPTGIRIRSTGTPGLSYTIKRALAVNGPRSTLATPSALASGLFEHLDTNPPASTAFYRTVQP
jgi:hypothetical protein